MVIYKIINLINKKIYIGKTISYKIDYFGSGILIKKSIKKYGLQNFKKEIIDNASSINELNEKEKYWINYFNSTDLNIGYNIGKGGNGGDLFTNHPNKEDIRKKYSKISEKNGMFGKYHKKESIDKISKNKKGQNKGKPTWNKGLKKEDYTKEQYKKMYLDRNCPNKGVLYIFISPNNKLNEVKGGFKKFCIENKLDYGMSLHLINRGIIWYPKKGKPKQERINLVGWEIRTVKYHKEIDKNYTSIDTKIKLKQKLIKRCSREKNINAKTFYIISPNGKEYKVTGMLPTFCKKNNINYYVVKRWINKGKILSSGRKEDTIRKNTSGWEIKTDKNIIVKNNRNYYILISPKNIKHILYYGLKNFCNENNLWYQTIIDNINKGKIKYPIKNFSEKRINSTDWEIIKVDNKFKEVKNGRL